MSTLVRWPVKQKISITHVVKDPIEGKFVSIIFIILIFFYFGLYKEKV